MTASDLNIKVVRNALSALENEPKNLSEFLGFFGKQLTGIGCISVDQLLDYATDTLDLNDPIRLAFHQRLSKWDYATSADWTTNTEPNTPERRSLVYKLLGLTSAQALLVDDALPFFVAEHTTVIAAEQAVTIGMRIETILRILDLGQMTHCWHSKRAHEPLWNGSRIHLEPRRSRQRA
jgi:hypothetical protein